jgi:sugar lactone lactonase YvrE
MIDVHEIDAPASVLGEGPLYLDKLLYWVDIEGRQVHRLRLKDDELHSFVTPSRPGCVAARKSGGVVVALEDGIYFLNETGGKCERLAHIPLANQRLNDGKCDSKGRLWVGSMVLSGPPSTGKLYRVDPDLSVHVMQEGITISNGIAWTQDDQTMFYIDTPTRKIDAFDFDAEKGTMSNRRTIVTVDPSLGHPDGMTIDQTGNLWVGMWGGSAVVCFDPKTGNVLDKINIPGAQNVTCPTFGGPLLDHLYVTTARSSEADRSQFPRGGRTFAAVPGAKGFAANAFGG